MNSTPFFEIKLMEITEAQITEWKKIEKENFDLS